MHELFVFDIFLLIARCTYNIKNGVHVSLLAVTVSIYAEDKKIKWAIFTARCYASAVLLLLLLVYTRLTASFPGQPG